MCDDQLRRLADLAELQRRHEDAVRIVAGLVRAEVRGLMDAGVGREAIADAMRVTPTRVSQLNRR